MKDKKQREDRRWGRNIQIWVVSRSRSSLSSVSRSLRNSHLPPLSLFLFLSFFFWSPAFLSTILFAASIGNPPVSYYSPVVRHCTRRTKHHGDSPAALSARDIWQYPNERSTGETTWEETRRRKVGWIKKERAGEIVSAPERVTTDFRPIVNHFDRKEHPGLLPLTLFDTPYSESSESVTVSLIDNWKWCPKLRTTHSQVPS